MTDEPFERAVPSCHYVVPSGAKKKFVCLCEDVTEKDICDAIDEAQAGKDIYCEKPTAICIRESRAAPQRQAVAQQVRRGREIAGRDDHRRRDRAAFGSERRDAARDGDAQPRVARVVRRDHRVGRGAQGRGIGRDEPERARRPAEP